MRFFFLSQKYVAAFELIVIRPDLIGGDLLLNEFVVGLVLVESADHVIAISPGVLIIQVAFESGGIGVPDHIQPVPAPAFAILRRGQ